MSVDYLALLRSKNEVKTPVDGTAKTAKTPESEFTQFTQSTTRGKKITFSELTADPGKQEIDRISHNSSPFRSVLLAGGR